MNKYEYVDHCWTLVEQFIDVDSKKYGKYVKQSVQDFRDFINDPKWEFNVEAVDKVFKFFSYVRIPFNDKYTQFPMLSWEAFLIAGIFGFLHSGTDKRKHTETLLFIARKNGKTAFASALVLYGFLKDGVAIPNSILLAMDRKQAQIALKSAKDIIYHSPALHRRLKPQQYKITSRSPENQGFIEIMSTVNPQALEGFNPSMCILDELHGFDSDKAEDVYNSIQQGTGARKNPLLFICTTAGTTDNQFMLDVLDKYKNVLDKKMEDDSIFGLIFQPDKGMNVEDEESWLMANPSVDSFEPLLADLRKRFRDAINSSSTRTYYKFITKRVNIFLEEPTDWLKPKQLDKCFRDADINDFIGQECFLGLDLSATSDLSALAAAFGNEELNEITVFVWFFMAKNPKMLRKGNFDLVPHIGEYIHRSKKDIVDYEAIIEKIGELEEKFQVVKLMYDRWNAPYVVSKIQEVTQIFCEQFTQSAFKFNVPLTFIQDSVANESITFATNPVLRWNFSNVVVESMDSNDNLKINKKKKKDAVDGVVAATQAIGGLIEYYNPIYENKG